MCVRIITAQQRLNVIQFTDISMDFFSSYDLFE